MNFLGLILSCAVFATLFLVTSSPSYGNFKLELGKGIDQKSGSLSKYKCIDGVVAKPDPTRIVLKTQMLKSINNDQYFFNLATGVSLDVFVLGGSINSSMQSQVIQKKNFIKFDFFFEEILPYERLSQIKINSIYWDRVRNLPGNRFIAKFCGDSYIFALKRGIKLNYSLIFSFDDNENLTKFTNRVNFHIGPFSKNVIKTLIYENKDLAWNLQVMLEQQGGNQKAFHQFKENALTDCNATNLNACETLLNNFFENYLGKNSLADHLSSDSDTNIIEIQKRSIQDDFYEYEVPPFTWPINNQIIIDQLYARLNEILQKSFNNSEDIKQSLREVEEIKTKIKQCYFFGEC